MQFVYLGYIIVDIFANTEPYQFIVVILII